MLTTYTACGEKVMKKQYIVIPSMFAMLLFAVSGFAEIRVVSVKGTAAFKAGGQWVPLQAGTALAVGYKVSTGVKSNAVIRIHNHTVTVQQLTIMKISESIEDWRSSSTRLSLRRGAVRAKVAKNARIRTVFKVSTPVATSSVRGTEELVEYSPTFGMNVSVMQGSVTGQGINGTENVISGKLNFTQRPQKGESDHPMRRIQDTAQTKTIPRQITPDEQKGVDLHGDDFELYRPNTKALVTRDTVVPVKVYLAWPRN